MFTIESVAQIHQVLSLPPPAHPLITVIGASWQAPLVFPAGMLHERVTSNLYAVSLKRGTECGLKYGRQNYDFQAGSVMCLAPGQSIVPLTDASELEAVEHGWTLIVHPDLLRGSALAAKMSEYSFFSYDSHEALHLSDAEQGVLTDVVKRIEDEFSSAIDAHTQEILVAQVQLLLTCCKRYYGRQFALRASVNPDLLARFERAVSDYFDSNRPASEGLLSVQACAKSLGYSADYLSDLLKRETGKSAREHIQYALVERAKTQLLGTASSISEIAYALGFEHPQHFSKLFRSKTGMSPAQFRQ